MAAPAIAAILAYIAKKGLTAAIKKYGREAVKKAEKIQIKRVEEKAAQSRKATKQMKKKERERLDPGFDSESLSLSERISSVARKLKEAKIDGDKTQIKRLEARLQNLRDIAADRPDTLIHKGTGGRFSRGGLNTKGHTDYRTRGLFS